MTVGAIAQIHNILTQAGLPQDRRLNITAWQSGRYTFSFMDNEGVVRYYEVDRSGIVIETTH